MYKFFYEIYERRLSYKRLSKTEAFGSRNNIEAGARGMIDKQIETSAEAKRIIGRLSSFRDRLSQNDLLTEEDQRIWQNKIKRLEKQSLSNEKLQELEREFNLQQGKIKGMVDSYTQNVLANKKKAFAIDTSRNLDTSKEYIEWFKSLPSTAEAASLSGGKLDKVSAFNKLQDEINERINIREQILKIQPDLKREVTKWKRSEMQDKLKELELSDKYIKIYSKMLNNDKQHFSKKSLKQFEVEFADLTTQEQEEWIKRYEKDIAKPRRELTKKHESLPKEYKNYKFFELAKHEKVEFFEKLELQLERDFERQVNKLPNTTWSEETKRFAIDEFRGIRDLGQKAYRLKLLPDFIKAEEELTKEYKRTPKEVRELEAYKLKNWERSTFKEKEKMLEQMETEKKLMNTFTKILDNELKDDVISKKTYERYMDRYKDLDLAGRALGVRGIKNAMDLRRELMEDFKKLSSEAQSEFKEFYKRGHKARLEIYKKALVLDKKKEAEKAKEDVKEGSMGKSKEAGKETKKSIQKEPQALEKKDVETIINELHAEAKTYEDVGKLEKALALHETVLKMHPQNIFSLKCKKELELEIEAMEIWSDENVVEALQEASRSDTIQEELQNIELSSVILDHYQTRMQKSAGREDIGKQDAHLNSEFDKKLHREIYEDSGGKYILDDRGRMKEVDQVDVGRLGRRRDETYKLKKELRELRHDRHLEHIDLRDEMTGRKQRFNEATDTLSKRKRKTAADIAKRSLEGGKIKGIDEKRRKELQKAAETYVDDETS